MAFGFIGDIIEEVGEAILPRGRRGATIGAALGGAPGAVLGQSLSQAISTPTVSQDPSVAPESAMSGDSGFVYQPTYTAGIAGRLPAPARTQPAVTTGLDMMDFIPDLEITKFFGQGACADKKKKLVSVDKDGCPYVTRKQQAVLRKMLMYLPIEEVAYTAGVTTDDVARMVSKQFAPRRRGISAADIRTANRVNNKLIRGVRKLGYNVSPMTKAELKCIG
jgi:hypothetical protein